MSAHCNNRDENNLLIQFIAASKVLNGQINIANYEEGSVKSVLDILEVFLRFTMKLLNVVNGCKN